MTETTRSIPVPLGELLERLRVEGFAVTPEVYGRVIRVLDAYYPEGIAPRGNATAGNQSSAADLQTLKELLCPVIARSEAEQLKFSLVFDEACKYRPVAGPMVPPVVQSSPVLPAKWLLAALAFALLLAGSWLAYEWWDGKDNPEMVKVDDPTGNQIDSVKGQEDSVVIARNDLPAEAPAYVPLIRAPKVEKVSYRLAAWVPLLLTSLGVAALSAAAYGLTARRRKAKPKDQPPYSFSFPNQEREIYVSRSVERWANQLQQRNEGQSRLVDLRKSIRATVKNGGYPIVCYKDSSHKPSYLVLIDNWSAHHQQARLYAFLAGCLAQSNVALETFFFHEDPRYCWNEKYPGGLPVEDVYRLHGTAHLVMITEGKRLLDHQRGKVAAWFAEPLAHWPSRILLTPVYPGHWNYVEATLSQFFVVLPATPDGQLRLWEFLHVTMPPAFAEMRGLFEAGTHTPPDRGVFGKSPAEMSVADVSRLLNQSFRVEQISDREKEYLNQWAFSTAVYLPPNWEVTIAIGKAIERHSGVKNLVNTTNLLKITALPWLKGVNMPAGLAAELLDALYPDVQAVARREVERLLVGVNAAPGSNAEEEKQIQLWEQRLHGGDARQRREAARHLRPFQKAGLLGNAATTREVAKYYRRLKGWYAIIAILIALLIWWLPHFTSGESADNVPDFPGREVAYEEITSGLDSAVYYNNLAADTFNVARRRADAPVTIRATVAKYLAISVGKRVTYEALYNLNALGYNQDLYDYSHYTFAGPADDSVRKARSAGDGAGPMQPPVGRAHQDTTLLRDSLLQYFRVLWNRAEGDTVDAVLVGNNRTYGMGGLKTKPFLLNQKDFADVPQKLGIGAEPGFRVLNVIIPDPAGVATKGPLRFYYDVSAMRSDQRRDSILSLQVDRILLYYQQQDTVQNYGNWIADQNDLTARQATRAANKGKPNPGYPPAIDSLPSVKPAPPDSTRKVTPAKDTTTIQKDIPGEYGVLVGRLKDVKHGMDNFVYILVEAGGEQYRVALQVSTFQSQLSPTITNPLIINTLKGKPVKQLGPYRYQQEQRTGFHPLPEVQSARVFNYEGIDQAILKNLDKPIGPGYLYDILEALSSSFREPIDNPRNNLRICVWGDRWQPGSNDRYFDLKRGYYEMRHVHKRRGTPAVRGNEEGSSQDGAIIIDYTKGSPGGLLSRFPVKLPLAILIKFRPETSESKEIENIVK